MKKSDVPEGAIKAVIFDIGGVLQLGGRQRINPRTIHTSGVHQRIADKLKISLDQYLDSIDTAYAKSIEGQLSEQTLLGILSLNLNYPKEKLKKLYIDSYRKIYTKNKWLFNVASQLKKQGYDIGILSDQWHISKEALITEKDFKIFENKIISCDVGMRKPDIRIYKMILEKMGVKPHEALFIDNQEWNIIPAHKLGMKTILFTDNRKIKEQLAHYGIHVK
ncbi:MAG: HAD family phosphatase [Nanoarchaeota archaeon]|jgi:putative hydrolase of the HAD superfamily|nr:HAD family phosphatase [Nanoarchaeota archaeon]